MKCEDFERIQLRALLGDASQAERERAVGHARSCEPCRWSGSLNRWLDAAFHVSQEEVDNGSSFAYRRLARLLDDRRVFCSRVDGPFGPVYLARTERGLCRVSFRRSENDFLVELTRHELLPIVAPDRVAREARLLEEYFSGRRKALHVPVDLRLVQTPFQKRVLEATAQIPFGEVVSYSDIARKIGQPKARRAVGGALGRNPVAIVIPCHRVVAADGSIGGYTGGLDIKRQLMRLEGIALAGRGRAPEAARPA